MYTFKIFNFCKIVFGTFWEKMCFIVMKMLKIICSFFFMHYIIFLFCFGEMWPGHVLDSFMCECVCVTTNGMVSGCEEGWELFSLCSVNGTSLFSVPGCYLGLLRLTDLRCLWERWAWRFLCWFIQDGCPDMFDRCIRQNGSAIVNEWLLFFFNTKNVALFPLE